MTKTKSKLVAQVECDHEFKPYRRKLWLRCHCGKTRHEKCKECDYGYPPNHPNPTEANNVVEEWNKNYDIGTTVDYVNCLGDAPERTYTRSIAWLCSNIPVVMIVGRAGGCAISHMTVVNPVSGVK